MKHLKNFNDSTEFIHNSDTIIKPAVIHIEDDSSVLYQNFLISPSSNLIAIYEVVDTNVPTKLCNYTTNMALMIVNGVAMSPNTLYMFLSKGTHTVEFVLTDPTIISYESFYETQSLKHIIIPNSVEIIKEKAFYSCKNLQEIVLSDSVITVEPLAFGYCYSATAIHIGKNVSSLAENATYANSNVFMSCDKVQTITVDPNNVVYDARNNCNAIIRKSDNRLYRGCGNTIIPEDCEIIGYYAFNLCSTLENLNIPNSVTSVLSSAFEGCTGVKQLRIGSGLTKINLSSSICKSLESITIDPNNSVYDSRDNCNAIMETASNLLWLGCSNTIIPETCTSIDQYAFKDCSSLTTINIPNSVTSIGQYAFENCENLESIVIPNSVTSIGKSIFTYCSNLTSIVVSEENTVYDSRNNCNAIIETATNTLVLGCKGSTPPEGIVIIGDYAFKNSNISSIVIPNSVTRIGNHAFYECVNLEEVILGESLQEIGKYAFYNAAISKINIPSNVTSIGEDSFYSCRNLKTITAQPTTAPSISRFTFLFIDKNGVLTIPANAIGYDVWMNSDSYYLGYSKWTYIEEGSYTEDGIVYSRDGKKIISSDESIAGSVVIKEGVEIICTKAFYNRKLITEIILPTTLISIGAEAFKYTSITELVIPEKVTTIGLDALYGTNLVKVTSLNLTAPTFNMSYSPVPTGGFLFVPENAEGYDVWMYRSGIPTTGFEPEGWKYLQEGMYYLENGLYYSLDGKVLIGADRDIEGSVRVKDGVTTIGIGAFAKCSKITEVILPSSVTSLSDMAFYECSLINISLPNSINTVGANVFEGSKVKTLTIPSSLVTIPEYAFSDMRELESVTIPSTVRTLKYGSFGNCKNLKSVDIKNGLTSIEALSFNGCDLKELTLPKSATSLGHSIFGDTPIHVFRCNSPKNYSNISFEGADEYGLLIVPDGATGYDWADDPNDVYSLGYYGWVKTESSNCVFEDGIYYSKDKKTIFATNGTLSGHVNIPEGVETIVSGAFKNCMDLTGLSLPSTINNVGIAIAKGCSSLTSITVDTNNPIYDSRNNCNAIIETATNKLVQGCMSTVIPESCLIVGRRSFMSIPITKIEIANSVHTIDVLAFFRCDTLKELVLGSSLLNINNEAFYYCKINKITSYAKVAPLVNGNRTFSGSSYTGLLKVYKGSIGYDVFLKKVYSNPSWVIKNLY